jgi:hypothetical protein
LLSTYFYLKPNFITIKENKISKWNITFDKI